jgi:hypothetical protein
MGPLRYARAPRALDGVVRVPNPRECSLGGRPRGEYDVLGV